MTILPRCLLFVLFAALLSGSAIAATNAVGRPVRVAGEPNCRLSAAKPKFVPGDKYHRGVRIGGSFTCREAVRARWDLWLQLERPGLSGGGALEKPRLFQAGQRYHVTQLEACPSEHNHDFGPTGDIGRISSLLTLFNAHDRVIGRAESKKVEPPC